MSTEDESEFFGQAALTLTLSRRERTSDSTLFPMFDIQTLLIVIPALPLAATLLTATLGKRVLRERSHLPTVTAIALSFVASILLLFRVQGQIERPAGAAVSQQTNVLSQSVNSRGLTAPGGRLLAFRGLLAPGYDNIASSTGGPGSKTVGYEQVVTLWRWANLEGGIDITLRADPLTAAMLAIVTCISALVAIYSIGYMHGDPGYWRFFTYISLFVFAMTMLVAASNFAVLYVFWEMVGLCSYLLIGFWFEKPAAAAAGKKAFLVTRLGDCGLLLGLFLIWTTYGTLDFHDTWINGKLVTMGVFGQARLASPMAFVGGGTGTAIGLLLLAGACGKSAQFPLHVWLPDAMEGPTPVSALIHAATMVTAGVYLIARCTPLMAASPDAQCVVAVIGGVTALWARSSPLPRPI